MTTTPTAAPDSATAFRAENRKQQRVLVVLAVIALAAVLAYCLIGLEGNWEYAMRLRTRKVAAMILVGFAVAYASVLFQTVTNNRILTPGIMGFDALFVLIRTLVVFLFGSLALSRTDPRVMFAVEVLVMIVFASALYRTLFGRKSRDLYAMVLVGVIFGTLFSSLTALVTRLIDPNEFLVLQESLFADFSSVRTELLDISAVLVVAAALYGGRQLRQLDVVALGRDHALNLGVDHRAVVNRALLVVAVLVSVSTALVGPITFLGLLVANLARQLTAPLRHRVLVPAAALIAISTLVGGQFLLEEIFDLGTTLSVIVNFVGGVYFIALLIRESRR